MTVYEYCKRPGCGQRIVRVANGVKECAHGHKEAVSNTPPPDQNPPSPLLPPSSVQPIDGHTSGAPQTKGNPVADPFLERRLPRLPIYLLLDCSGSMSGDPITAVSEGVTMIHRELSNDPQALETVYISIITFASQANQYPLTPIDQFRPPKPTAGGARAMGAALRILAHSIEQDLIPNRPPQHGDYRPLVFLLTDGVPTDNYKDALQKVHSLRGSQRPTIVALGCGGGVNEAMLHEVTENVFLMHTVTPTALKGFFKWLSGSIVQTSHAAASAGAAQPMTMTPPTAVPGITYSPS